MIATPLIVVALLELGRLRTIGVTSLQSRIPLDGLVAAALLLLGILMLRVAGTMQRRLQRQNEELLALHGAGLDVTAELSLDAVLEKVVDRARTLVGARYGALSVVNADGSIRTFITSGVTAEQRARIGAPPVGHGLLGVVLREGERLRLSDIGSDARSHGFPPNHPQMRSLLAVPITCKGPFVGNLYLSEKERGGQFTESDEETLERFAVSASIAIDNAHLHSQAERQNQELLALHGAGLDSPVRVTVHCRSSMRTDRSGRSSHRGSRPKSARGSVRRPSATASSASFSMKANDCACPISARIPAHTGFHRTIRRCIRCSPSRSPAKGRSSAISI